jgi:hypothetical protein
MINGGGATKDFKERWSAGEITGVSALIRTRNIMKKGQALTLAESYRNPRTDLYISGPQQTYPVQIALGVWPLSAMSVREGASVKPSPAQERLFRLTSAMGQDLNLFNFTGKAVESGDLAVIFNNPVLLKRQRPEAKSCESVRIQQVWAATG